MLHAPRIATDQRGNILIEFALAMPVLFMMLVGLFDLGTYAYQKSAMLQGAREGAQYGMLNSSDTANINLTAKNATGLSGVTAGNTVFCECTAGTTVLCTSTCTGGSSPRKYITVTTTKSFTSMFRQATMRFGSFGSWTPPSSLSASVTMLATGG